MLCNSQLLNLAVPPSCEKHQYQECVKNLKHYKESVAADMQFLRSECEKGGAGVQHHAR